jgi:hypothetical protein
MTSKYDEFWRDRLPQLQTMIDRAAMGASPSQDVSTIQPLGERDSWNGTALVRGRTLLRSSNAHADALGEIVAKAGLCEAHQHLQFRFTISKTVVLTVTSEPGPNVSDVSHSWHLSPGDKITRKELSQRYGGNPEAGIAPSAKSPNLFVFSDPATGEKYGYHDHFDGEVLHYYGMGRFGPQQMEGANKALLNHRDAGRAVRVFQGAGGEITYLGEFELDPEEPYYWDEARDWDSEDLRPVIVFKLRPVDYTPQEASDTQADAGRPPYKPADENKTSTTATAPVPNPDAMDRATNTHSKLQNLLATYAQKQGASTHRRGSLDPDFDLSWTYDDHFTVAEIKSLTTANETSQLRLGLGQLLHYGHQIAEHGQPPKMVLFVEHEPSYAGWVELCGGYGVQLLWPEAIGHLKLD